MLPGPRSSTSSRVTSSRETRYGKLEGLQARPWSQPCELEMVFGPVMSVFITLLLASSADNLRVFDSACAFALGLFCFIFV